MLTIKPTRIGCCTCARCGEFAPAYEDARRKTYCATCVDEMIQTAEAEWYRNTAHRPNNPVWQINYQLFTLDDLKDALAEDGRLPLLTAAARELLSFLSANPEASWSEAANHIRRSHWTAKERFKLAMCRYRRRQAHPEYRPSTKPSAAVDRAKAKETN